MIIIIYPFVIKFTPNLKFYDSILLHHRIRSNSFYHLSTWDIDCYRFSPNMNNTVHETFL